jgi:hypothetical protein
MRLANNCQWSNLAEIQPFFKAGFEDRENSRLPCGIFETLQLQYLAESPQVQ